MTRLENKISALIFIFLFIGCNLLLAQHQDSLPNVHDYLLVIEPNIKDNTIKGNVIINFQTETKEASFNCGNLLITNVNGTSLKSYIQEKNKVIVQLSEQLSNEYQLQFYFEGSPKRGLIFNQKGNFAYTNFSTDQWMVCNMDPSDRASIKLDLIIPDSLSCISNGHSISAKPYSKGKMKYSWEQYYTTPAYTYGFAIGPFIESNETIGGTEFKYFSSSHNHDELLSIFKKTSHILSFLEEKAGVSYIQESYSQILMGNHYQEMSGFSVLKESYGSLVLNDSLETNLITHELAHQWWGNMITCESWGHFWLNEGFATFLSAAYNEYRFGAMVYQSNIDSYFDVYQRIKEKGADKPLVFPDWKNPTRDDRNLVYFKGAYVLHLLREELGNVAFWKGIKNYTQSFYNQSVTTEGFQEAMEKSSGIDLSCFFKEWVY